MMKIFDLPASWDARKFAARYGLDANRDFYIGGDGKLTAPDSVPDTPIFDPPDDPIDALRNMLASMIDDALEPQSKLLRGALAAIFEEFNLHAAKINQILNAVDAATSLADLKTRVALIVDYPQRTPAQARSAVKAQILAGGAD